LPRATAMDEASGLLLVTCLGIDAVIGYQADKQHPHNHERRRWKVAAGPTGIAVDAEARRALVWSQFDGVLSVVSLDAPKGAPQKADASARISIARPPAPDLQVDLGRRLFHSAGGLRIAADGRACASCHPDGRDDALTWSSPDGPRQTPMLLGRLEGTAPYGWSGERNDLAGHFKRTLERLSGMGLRAEERDAIFAYLRSLPPPVAPEAAAAAVDPHVARGETLFHDEATGCSSCHLGDEVFTDHASHNVSSSTLFDLPGNFDTPSLRFIGKSAPYFHDGRYPTMIALLKGVDGTMGHTKHLSEADLQDLSAYLETL
jgi:cytochrome c peroxidase